ncbi:trimeric intracellular cation channel family protein [Echinicola strongylocentroti]|uniref:Trimeric intracellular cation channel family protein n=1 Tax=Echinicola strongylocentroti TaxID=1795355 RepID=A0A2Z4IIL0_9BACT|nr:trimeric intracellular cation channel family protein [Echinicola strongylocentroti]AWW30972.1 trimeric intracellular cation channel family protein [Echinicola strongylocentroti]
MDLQFIFELVGTYFFAVSGALAVHDREHDVFGAGFTGFITAIGGGTLRDVLLDSYPLVWIDDVSYLYAIFAGILTAILFFKIMSKLRKTLFLFDTLGIALFSVLGAEKALSLGVRPEIAAMMGMFSAVMGGVIRDMLCNATPILLKKEVYATACLSGAILVIVLQNLGVERNVNLILSFLLVVTIRLIAVRFKLSLPQLDWKK